MGEAHFRYDADAGQQPYYCNCSALYSSTICSQENSCFYSCSTKDYTYDSSASSTPFVSAPSSPRKSTTFPACCSSAPATLAAWDHQARDLVTQNAISAYAEIDTSTSATLSDFEFSPRFSEADTWLSASNVSLPCMSTAEELFCNGKIKPLNSISYSSSASYCICINDGLIGNQHGYRDPAAYTEGITPSLHAEYHEQPHPLMLRQRSSGHAKPTSTPSALEQWKKSMESYEKGISRQNSTHGQHAENVIQISNFPLAQYNRNSRRDRGHHRRARSLSPMRVFHMDEKMMQARDSFESEPHTNTKISRIVVDEASDTTRHQGRRKKWTLKELLSAGGNRVRDEKPHLRRNGVRDSLNSGSASALKWTMVKEAEASRRNAKDNAVKRSSEEEQLQRNNEEVRSPWKLQQAETEHADQYSCSIGSAEGLLEEMGTKSVLHSKKGLLGCLGFATRHSSFKGLPSCIP